ncbi:MAG: N-6 DNA methylase, partial [Solirubrobacteraceae bacterium]
MATIRSEGGLLPADVLARVAALDRDLGGLNVSDFHLAPNERLGEAIARSWARLTAAWDAFSTDRDGLPAGAAGRLTRERWLLPLFSELGYGRLIQQSGVEIEGKTYAVFCEYNHSPIHLVGAGVPLDRRTAGVRGAADQSPHSIVQELLNRSTERLWGIVTNGLSLRLLRDNVTLTRQAYVEFDLEAIMATEAYEDFALLWLCAHQSRLEAENPAGCWLERWTQAAQRDGTRALGELRSGVQRAIEALGRGFLAQPANTALHDTLRAGNLDGPAYYRELLRLIYRLLFLFVAEDRDALLLPDDGTPERFDARERYHAYYATKRLRRLSVRRRGGRAHDLYEQVKLLSSWLHHGGQPVLALPPLGSALWNPETTAHISDACLGNEALLEAIRELAYVEGGRRPADFRNLGAEELGSVYESLLELHPAIDRETASFVLATAAGHERKQTGSYYTPTSLIGSLQETALDPVIEAAVKSDDPGQALLDLTVCDPACGSGHFLIAAANRIAKRLAGLRERDPEPAPEAIR